METRKLEFKEISGYIPYGLMSWNRRPGGHEDNFVEMNVVGYSKGSNKFHLQINVYNGSFVNVDEIKPILRPLSDLYKSITHNGKEIVPIVECFNKILIIGNKNLDGNSAYDSISRNWLSLDCDNNFIIQYMLSGNKVYDNISTKNNLRLLDYLYELKIDYRGLIDADLAVDVNTLSINPYK